MNILLDSDDLLIIIDYGVDFVLNNHKHVPNVWMIENKVTLNFDTFTLENCRVETFHSKINKKI